jgi:integrase
MANPRLLWSRQPLKIEQSRRADPKTETFGHASTWPSTTDREVERLIEAAKQNRSGHRDATAILVAYRHGLRASELVALRWHDIDLATGRLHVRRAKSGGASVHPISARECRALRKLLSEAATSRRILN